MIVITSPASDVWRVQSKDPRLLSFVVKVVLAMDPNAVNAFSKPLRYSVGVNVLIEHVNDALGHAGDVKNSKPEFYDVAHFLSGCSGKGKDLISFLQPWDCNLFKEIFVCDVAAIFGDPEELKSTFQDLHHRSFLGRC